MLHTLAISLTAPSGQKSASIQLSASADGEFDEVVPPTTTNMPFSLALDISQVKSLFLLSDQDVTLKTNSSSSPTDTIALKANIPYVWFTNAYDTCKITADVTTAFITNAGATAANVSARWLYDITP
jgi:hypothetical protein